MIDEKKFFFELLELHGGVPVWLMKVKNKIKIIIVLNMNISYIIILEDVVKPKQFPLLLET